MILFFFRAEFYIDTVLIIHSFVDGQLDSLHFVAIVRNKQIINKQPDIRDPFTIYISFALSGFQWEILKDSSGGEGKVSLDLDELESSGR